MNEILTEGLSHATLGEMAAKDLGKAKVFKKYGLDFCCGGRKTLQQACEERGLDTASIEKELLATATAVNGSTHRYNEWKADFLSDYIVNTHHAFVRQNLPMIMATADKVKRVHGREHPELLKVHELMTAVNDELMMHMMKEENVLFPYIKSLQAAHNEKKSLPAIPFGTVANPIAMMETEHETVGDAMKEIREVTSDYALPEGACGSYTFLYRMLDEFEGDLHMHIHLENNILFPAALAMEEELKGN